jgi:anti-sigma factor ChrR (cupin superfamily)
MARHDPPDQSLPDFEPLQPSAELRRRVLASVEPASRLEGFVSRFATLFDLSEQRAREVLSAGEGPHATPGWVAEPLLPGLHLFHFPGGPRVATADCGLVYLTPGLVFPRHRHLGLEWNFILSGSAEETDGTTWLPGDLLIREPGSVHGYRALADEPLLFAVVLEGGLDFAVDAPPPEPD